MFSGPLLPAVLCVLLCGWTSRVHALLPSTNNTIPPPDPDGKYTLTSTGIRAQFIPYGASISNLFVSDRNGTLRDVVGGFDNASHYTVDAFHPHFGGVPGRYANRIANASFSIDGVTYEVDANEHDGENTLHGGSNGWDYRNFSVTALTNSSITFSLFDPAGTMGFPGDVLATVTYTLEPYTWHLDMAALALTEKTPLMLSSHVYWNLDGWANPDSRTVYDHYLHLPYSGMRVGVDGDLIPTGELLPNKEGSVNDFWSAPKAIGRDLDRSEAVGNCGTNCTGYDTCFLVSSNRPSADASPVATLGSPWSGIEVQVFSEQEAFQVYSCAGMNGSLPLKSTQGTDTACVIEQGGCLVMEVEDWIDGINQPEWGRKQVWGPEDGAYTLSARYVFNTVD